MEPLLQNLASYLQAVLGVSVVPILWQVPDGLPFFLRDQYHFSRMMLLDTPCLLLHDPTEREMHPLALSKHFQHIRQYWDGEVAYLFPAISPYLRKRLIAQKIPFVVPGTQLYLPSFGMDLREYYKKLRPRVTEVSPSAQAVIIHALCHDSGQLFTPSMLAKRLGYTRMTMARAFDELDALDIGKVIPRGKERVLQAPNGKQALWLHARGIMRNPVKKRVWTWSPVIDWPGVVAGLTALASYTLLVPPTRPVYAMSASEWRGWKKTRNDAPEFEIPDQDEQTCELELWCYSPRLCADRDRVDPFSLYLSLQSQEDERVQSALEEMMEQVRW